MLQPLRGAMATIVLVDETGAQHACVPSLAAICKHRIGVGMVPNTFGSEELSFIEYRHYSRLIMPPRVNILVVGAVIANEDVGMKIVDFRGKRPMEIAELTFTSRSVFKPKSNKFVASRFFDAMLNAARRPEVFARV